MILHTINKSPTESNCFADCISVITRNCGILLLENGVYAGLKDSPSASSLKNTHARCYALEADVLARGLQEQLLDSITLVDYDGFVKLVEQHDCVQSWY